MVTLSTLKRAANIPPTDDRHNELLAELEAAAVAYVQRRTGWYVGPVVDHDFTVEGTGTRDLWLPERASAVSAVTERPYPGGTATAIATGADDGWTLRKEPGTSRGLRLVRQGGYVWTAGYEYTVTATIGYQEGAAPDDDMADVTALVVHWFENRLPVAVGTVAPPITNHLSARLESRRRRRA